MIDIDSIMTPIPGENPAGEDLRYTEVYDSIKEARRADDDFDLGDWSHEIKTSDWNEVIRLSVEALTQKTKDLQIAAWLTEALTKEQGFEGLSVGLKIIAGFLETFWDHLYPEIDEGDLDYRVGPLEFLNKNLWLAIKEIPVTDSKVTTGYSWLKWEESRQVGYDKDILNQYGDVDEHKKARRDEMLAEGKLKADDFDLAVAASSRDFYEKLKDLIDLCQEEFEHLDNVVDEKFGKEAPRLSEIKGAISDCNVLITKILKEKKALEPEPETSDQDSSETEDAVAPAQETGQTSTIPGGSEIQGNSTIPVTAVNIPVAGATDSDSIEQALWEDALSTLQASGLRDALSKLLNASCTASSIRQKNRYRLLIAKLCLRAERPDLARPVLEDLHSLIEQLNLEQWESPIWIAEALDAYYQCLTAEGASDDDIYKANNELFQRLCTKDITKAIRYRT